MKRERLLHHVTAGLEDHGFRPQHVTGCFDVVGRKQEIVSVKVLEDVNSLTISTAGEMHHLAGVLSSRPLVVADHGGISLEDGIVYTRHGIYVLTLDTFLQSLAKELPFLLSQRGGVSVAVNQNTLSACVRTGEMSIGQIARLFGVSREMARRYLVYGGELSFARAQRMFAATGSDAAQFFQPLQVFTAEQQALRIVASEYSRKYEGLGFTASDVRRAAFQVAARKSEELILTHVGDRFENRLRGYCSALHAGGLVIFQKRKPRGQMAALQREEFLEWDDPEELIKVVKEEQ